jgi:uncharacterized membrane protein YfcA
LPATLIGLGAGVVSGMFGIGGGIITTPAIRMLLGYPDLIAVGTPLPVILPTAITGAVVHARQGSADVRTGLLVGVWGVPAAVAGAALTRVVGGGAVLAATAAVIVFVAIDMLLDSDSRHESFERRGGTSWVSAAAVGVTAGFCSGFLGLGAGFVLVPLLSRVLDMELKRAIGTSLVSVAIFAVPGSITHWALGHVDLNLALALTLGVIFGAVAGARLNHIAAERTIRVFFAVILGIVGILFGLTEAGVL